MLAGEVEKAAESALQALHGIMGAQSWEYEPARRVLRRLGALSIEGVPKEMRDQILCYAAFFGLLEAMWRNYSPVFPGLIRTVEEKKAGLPATQKAQLEAMMQKLVPATLRRTPPSINTTGSLLPSAAHKATVTSIVSGGNLTGTTVALEDGVTHITRSESIMWRTVNPFSPLSSGRLIAFA